MPVDTSHLHGSTDAQAWGEAFRFVRLDRLARDGFDIANDPATMATWFANAFMAKYDSIKEKNNVG